MEASTQNNTTNKDALPLGRPPTSINGEEVAACLCDEGVSRWAYVECKAERNFYATQQKRAVDREITHKKRISDLENQLRLLKQKFYGKKSEKSAQTEKQSGFNGSKNPRGHQKGAKGHGKNKNTSLPVVDEFIELPEDLQECSDCHKPFIEINATEDSELIEISVKAHVRKVRRKKYTRNCQCHSTPRVITAPALPKLLTKMNLGLSVWVELLIRKYEEQVPMNRVLNSLKKHGILISQGTVTGGLKRLVPALQPIAKAFEVECQKDKHWHADETRWQVFEKIEDKESYRWWLWVFRGRTAITFRIEPTRGYVVPEDFFKDVDGGILNCDRYVVYKKLANNMAIILALCWAHVRRDFLDAMKSSPELEEWAMWWVEAIRDLYRINKLRLNADSDSETYQKLQKNLANKLGSMEQTFNEQLETPDSPGICKKVLTSLKNHWKGLTVFRDHPEIPMDNNKGEQTIRPSTIGRKNYYGSGSVWSAELTAILFSIFSTLSLWKLNSRSWLLDYFRSCELNGGKAPEDLSPFLPWKMSAKQTEKLIKPPDDG